MKGMIMSAESVRAILEGRKTVARSSVWPQPPEQFIYPIFDAERGIWADSGDENYMDSWPDEPMMLPHKVGEMVYVMEAYLPQFRRELSDSLRIVDRPKTLVNTIYHADLFDQPIRSNLSLTFAPDVDESKFQTMADLYRWTAAKFMPEAASRITLRITSIGLERLHDITDAEALREGITEVNPSHVLWKYRTEVNPSHALWKYRFGPNIVGNTAIECYANAWEKLRAEEYPWASNPWVWRVEFEVLPEREKGENTGNER